MGAVFNGIILGITGLSLFPLGEYFFPPKKVANTVVRVAAGLSQPRQHNVASTGGTTPNVALFNENGERIGFLSGQRHGVINDGNFGDIVVAPIDSKNNNPATYISLSASSSDAICIAYVAVTHPSGEYWAFSGDSAVSCGAAWYLSNLEMQGDDENKVHKPKCFWIDGPGDDGKVTNNFPQGIGIHLTDFVGSKARSEEYQANKDAMCKSRPRLHMYKELTELNCLPIFNPPLSYDPENRDKDIKAALSDGEVMCKPGPDQKPTASDIIHLRKFSSGRFSVPTYGVKRRIVELSEREEKAPGRACFTDDIVISDSMGAKELCDDPNSHGPDFVSIKEGYYCDMCSHELFPLCHKSAAAAKNQRGCFDVDTKKMRYTGDIAARGNGTIVPDKSYQRVRVWK
ncbi:hypothetical protein McanMca71_007222 [Microsporum canis]|uniref:Uncharacterized protein n=1 Tax=Arthroderma otae (strain ATCC MYA-4605 / CBS 113480) TaxID=554155 RepID=C5FMT5_ARTOC|nr:conserved hypothetical protein [Microsporum canis CBS 113480]EEQ31906.1 conserved hypothetical protein [Microsporum canis CBS 113480]